MKNSTIAGRPVSRLLGGTSDRVKAYVTCVWKGKPDQSHVSYDGQAAMAARLSNRCFHVCRSPMSPTAIRPNAPSMSPRWAESSTAGGGDWS